MSQTAQENRDITGKAVPASEEAAAAFLSVLKKLIEEKGYHSKQVFSYSETGLFRKKMLDRTYVHQSAKEAPGLETWKDRLTDSLWQRPGHRIKPGVVYGGKNSLSW